MPPTSLIFRLGLSANPEHAVVDLIYLRGDHYPSHGDAVHNRARFVCDFDSWWNSLGMELKYELERLEAIPALTT